ncbi:TrpB-like pyridoxal phosphate-dependent enzyme [Propioniciclava sp. MC1595]|uniref:TrpB-like pyridoxal phosphate-dependent enzyme n=1 Tax=unclassified Propioniciclava TaxID=2642922 RepID=UPI0016005009|nr:MULTISPECIES: TrpB-like pyridoxal phosphate-dependent enzyme [unclassified Propioniciclava]MBB1493569.1 TrpB-like pyridoxal phosphate-dependent enzyme [Propioniciclava sp. MC1595]MBB1500068.1 TrpB-like pyridoxal phosphate-dependent enzyme [Propioniciclava sp. MC1683]QTE26961.1 TrpB-like pyridoxal phosphate-dependent enzyme [Propioniciclava sp. MC1595]
MAEPTKVFLDEDDIPTHWYNIVADFPTPPPPPLHPGTKEPLVPDDLAALFPMGLIAQEASTERWIEIPEKVREIYRLWRPSPLHRARRLEAALGTTARIYYKYEGESPVGSHKTNSAVPQAYYNAQEGRMRLTTETGAGQWGSALAFATQIFGQTCDVWQVRNTYEGKPYRRILMETFGATVTPSPSDKTEVGRALRERFPDTTGSLGMAISEAIEEAAKDPGASYSLGSVLNHVTLHQSIIGLEAIKQLEKFGEQAPDMLFACAGGGSNLAGIAFPFLRENIEGRMNVEITACEPAAAPSLTQGEYRYDFGDSSGMTPLLKMYTLGNEFVPDPVHAGGLRYHGMAPLVSHAYHEGLMKAIAVKQRDAFAAGVEFARAEGIVPASESNHAIAGALAAARKATEDGTSPVILIGVSGSGQLDLPAYAEFLAGNMLDA